jgi:hypothetical protein
MTRIGAALPRHTSAHALRGMAASFLILVAIPPHAAADQEKAITAVRLIQPIRLDGVLDDAEWERTEPVSGFVQADPEEGAPSTERTEVRVLFDEHNLYFGVYCYDSEPDKIIVNDLRRDFDTYESDVFGVMIDPLHDLRNGFSFFTNAAAALNDTQGLNDGRIVDRNWDGIWHVAARRNADGWSAEMIVPFRTLGLRASVQPVMGINFKRRIRRKSEDTYWRLVPRRFGTLRASMAGRLDGLADVQSGLDMRVKPFVTTEGVHRRNGSTSSGDLDAEVGVDVKYRVSHGMALDLTYNTDFSQVEVDTEQINLTRFSLFFPEKREFFLENAGIFHLGDVAGERGTGPETQLFYSRRIGLSARGTPLPLLGGGRLSGHAGPYAIGVLNIQQERLEDQPSNNFTVARVSRDLIPGSGSDVGVLFINRQGGTSGDYNRTYAADLNLQFRERLTFNSFVAGTDTPGLRGANKQVKFSSRWDNGVWLAQAIYTDIGENFRPEVGFVPRVGVRNVQLNTDVRLRPGGFVREIRPNWNVKYFANRDNVILTRDSHYELEVLLDDSSRLRFSVNPQFDRLEEPFEIRSDVFIPVGDYTFNEYRILWDSDRSRTFSTSGRYAWGPFYDGDRTTRGVTGRVNVRPHLAAEVSYTSNLVDLKGGSFRADLYGVRVSYVHDPRLLVDAFVQYNTDTDRVLTNLRFRFTHRPLSDISVALVEDRASAGVTDVNRALVVKYSHLLQF